MKNLIILLIFIGGFYVSYKHFKLVRMADRSRVVATGNKAEIENIQQIETTSERITPKEIINEIISVFDEESVGITAKMIYVISRESGFKPDAMNWNCRYNGKSMGCKKGDLDKAWSVDCGIMQLNYPGKYCPGNVMDWKTNIALGYQKFKRQGMNAWVASWDL